MGDVSDEGSVIRNIIVYRSDLHLLWGLPVAGGEGEGGLVQGGDGTWHAQSDGDIGSGLAGESHGVRACLATLIQA